MPDEVPNPDEFDAERMKAYELTYSLTVKDYKKQECFAHYGYGLGRVISQSHAQQSVLPHNPKGHSVKGGCESCPKAQDCWQATIKKAWEVMPNLGSLEEELFEKHKGQPDSGLLIMADWGEETGQATENNDSFMPPPSILFHTIMLRIGAQHAVELWQGPTAN